MYAKPMKVTEIKSGNLIDEIVPYQSWAVISDW
jgi:hypothetical protein